MGYECPVCATPQTDRRHLADHLAVTAMTHGDEHADWLDEHVPGWSDHSPEELGDAVAEHATETGYDQVFEDTVGTRGDHEHDHGDAPGRLEDALADANRGQGRGDLTDADRGVLEEARELTREMLEGEDADDGGAEEDDESDGDEPATDGTTDE